jgi:serine protease Do
MAIGNPFNLAHTVTVGVISAVDRPFPVSEGRWQHVLQTDAAINPGNSGGPLLNLRGEVIGINTAIAGGGGRAGNVGVGFAIPIDVVNELLPELRTGTVTRGRIGVQIMPVTRDLVQPLGLEDAAGAVVRVVEEGGPAADAGLEPGDVIVGYDGRDVEESDDLVRMVTRTEPGNTVSIDVVRDGQRMTRSVTVAPLEMAGDAASQEPDAAAGMTLRNVPADLAERLKVPDRGGVLVADVTPGGAAARAGLRRGDVILEVNRASVAEASAAAAALRQTAAGDTVFLLLWRQGRELFVTMRMSD